MSNSNRELPKIILLEMREVEALPVDFNEYYHTHLYCQRGSIRFKFNDNQLKCKAGEFLFWFSKSRLSELEVSKSFKATALLVETDFLNDNVPDQGWSIKAILHSRTYPIKPVREPEDRKRVLSNFRNLNNRFLESSHHFYDEILKLQMRVFVLEMWHLFVSEYERRKHSLQTGTLYEQFMHLLEQHCMQEREVQFYAQKLFISAKHLNFISKRTSGVAASKWIQRFSRERIEILLQNKQLNIAEIADEMEFSSRSFFTRYVKKVLGLTPSEYRNRLG